MPRTTTNKAESLDFKRGPREIATFQFLRHHSDAAIPSSRLIIIPPGSIWNTGLHWHEEYVEKVKVRKGKARITIGEETNVYEPEDGVLTFPKFTIHGFGRGDGGNSADDEEETVLEEWVDPEDGVKVIFFYNILSGLLDANGQPGIQDAIQLGTILAFVDEYPAVPGPWFFKYLFMHAALGGVSWLGWALGYKPWLEEYTPKDLWDVAWAREERGNWSKSK